MRKVVGLEEIVEIKGRKIKAKIDTGASRSSIDIKLAAELELGPIIGSKRYKSSLGGIVRPVVKEMIKIKGKRILARFNIAHRKRMEHKILIGRGTLKAGKFLVDPSR